MNTILERLSPWLFTIGLFVLWEAACRIFKVNQITLPAPSNFLVTSYRPGITDRVYRTRAEMLRDLVDIVRDEIQWLAAEGVPYVQLDAPYYSTYLDPRTRERLRQAGLDPERGLEEAIAADNRAIQGGRRPGMVLGLHVCRGNSRSRWIAEGGYEAIAGQLFGRLDVDRFLLEYDSERAGGFEALRLVPPGKTVVLGLSRAFRPGGRIRWARFPPIAPSRWGACCVRPPSWRRAPLTPRAGSCATHCGRRRTAPSSTA